VKEIIIKPFRLFFERKRNMREKILIDIKNAMKNQNKDLLNVLRMVKGAMQLEEINKKRELNDEEVVAVISKQIKTRKETITELSGTNRQEAISQAEREIAILQKYMPEMMSEEEITKIIEEVIAEVQPTGMQDIGKMMGKISPLVKGKADMTLVNKMVREKIQG